MKTTLSFLITLIVLCSTIQTVAQTATANNKSYIVLPASINRTTMLKLVNEARKKGCQCGDTYYTPAPPLAWNTSLEEAAYNHSVDMSENRFFSHKAPDGSRASDRISRTGYRWKNYGENIGHGYKTEKDVVQGWLSSPGHCKNIMNKNFKDMGAARSGNLWTQVFGSK